MGKKENEKQQDVVMESVASNANDEVRTLKHKIASLKAANTRLSKENSGLKEKISSVSSSRDKSLNAKTTLEHDKAVLEEKVNELVNTNSSLLKTISELEDAKTDAEARLEAFLALPWYKRIFL